MMPITTDVDMVADLVATVSSNMDPHIGDEAPWTRSAPTRDQVRFCNGRKVPIHPY